MNVLAALVFLVALLGVDGFAQKLSSAPLSETGRAPGLDDVAADGCAVRLLEDCLVSGLAPSSGGPPFPPIVSDIGTAMGTNGAGCDGCTVRWNVSVTWMEDGNGTTEVGGIRNWGPVRFGDTTTITSPTLNIGCDSSTILKVVGHSGSWFQYKVSCFQCQ